jgi:carboxymethylenebutenolidase
MDPQPAGTGYLALPDAGRGPGVLVLHAWWGLNDAVRDLCDRLAGEGFVALAPDLFGGASATAVDDAERLLGEADADRLAHLTRSSLHTLRALDVVDSDAVGLVGLSMGASMAMWLAARVPVGVAATVLFYGDQDVDLAPTQSAFLGHFAEVDPYVDDDQVVLMEAELRLHEREVEFHRYPGTHHWFFEEDRPEHDPDAAALAWDRTVTFLRRHLPGRPPAG